LPILNSPLSITICVHLPSQAFDGTVKGCKGTVLILKFEFFPFCSRIIENKHSPIAFMLDAIQVKVA